jgi:crotonobetainyl-CoA:carnitine CoA-transferase CaiB-like acyl-CoA transferase
MTEEGPGPLAHLSVVDLTTERGWLAGKLLADLGSTVVRVEPPGGDDARIDSRVVPGVAPGGANPAWHAFNRGKQFVTLDLRRPEGRSMLLSLIATSDAVIESFGPSVMEELGLGYEELSAANPALVLTRISPFGQTGPYAKYAASELTVAAMAGAVWVTGDPDRPPVRISSEQSFLHAATEAVVHTVAATHYAARSGMGQTVDISAQLSVMRILHGSAVRPHIDGTVVDRTTFGMPNDSWPYQTLYACADGYVVAQVSFPRPIAVVQWLRDVGELPQDLDGLGMEQLSKRSLAQELPWVPPAINAAVAELMKSRTKIELADEALRRGVILLPVNTVADLFADEQLAAREYFSVTPFASLGSVLFAHEWAKLGATPLLKPRPTAPPGSDNELVWVQRLGMSPENLEKHMSMGVV